VAALYRTVADNRAREIAAGVDMDLEIAQFEADHGSPSAALAAASREWGRRHSVHVADALAWALYRSGRPGEALRYSVAATRLGTPDAHFWLHRAAIEAALQRDSAARAHLCHGLRVDPGVAVWLAAEVRGGAGRARPCLLPAR
jgi:Flp pilus assembly protein TadD